MVRMKEKRREKAAKKYVTELLGKEPARLVSSWGPYITTSGTAKETGVQGLTVPVKAPSAEKKGKKSDDE
jgi:hypothetical protein